ncbi:uncharacterized protein LOC112575383 isoform X2 [Pomacea canaliculata]|nr:uncharacterized protein LOC112575383 isoform X2 [Pomacea canaliculata]XP_025113003.1 uncharacterized protein LOC112575383 isoform X2 [Pomacea canaliculata]
MDGWFKSRGSHPSGRSLLLRFFVSALFFSLYISLHSNMSAVGNQIMCDAPSVKPKRSTVLTCYFPEDVSETRRDFTVYRYTDGRPVAVLDCWWWSGNLSCFTAEGYKYDRRISTKLSLVIPRVSVSELGTYDCRLTSYGPDSFFSCVLNIKLDGRSACDIPSVKPETQTAVTCYFPEDLSKSRTDFRVYHHSSKGSDAVLNCTWDGDILTCTTSEGFQFDRRVSKYLTLTITNASEAHEGTYSCQSSGSEPFLYDNCSFRLQKAANSSCSVTNVKDLDLTELTCIFSVDISKARQDFRVISLKGRGITVVSCNWLDDQLDCTNEPGYALGTNVTDRVVITLPRTSRHQNVTYVCHLEGSEPADSESCDVTYIADPVKVSYTTVIVVASIGAASLIAIIISCMILLCRLRREKRRSLMKGASEENLKLLRKTNKEITHNFISYLTSSCLNTYKDIDTRFYFVPSLYLNKNTYTPVEFAGEKVLITRPSTDTILRHDQAMHQLLQNLYLLAQSENEAMFVISQFKYNNYLAMSEGVFNDHQLPMPDELGELDKDYGNFDLLIVHRKYGLMVVVVRACSPEPGDNNKEKDDSNIFEEIDSGVRQLQNAECVLPHVLSYQHWDVPVRKTLMLPNVSQEILRRVLRRNNMERLVDAEGRLNVPPPLFRRDKLKTGRPTRAACLQDKCLWAEQLNNGNTTWHLKQLMNCGLTNLDFSPIISHEQYLTVISRFCSPVLEFSLSLPDVIPRDILPVTCEHAVSLTGELFESPILHEGHLFLLEEGSPRVGLLGPPGTGKTRTLELMGRRWRSQGHDVFVVSTWTTSRVASRLLFEILSTTRDGGRGKQGSRKGRVTLMEFDLMKESVTEVVQKLEDMSKKGKLFILCDEAEPDSNSSSFMTLCEKLLEKVPALHLWYASCFHLNVASGWQGEQFVEPVSCPPAVLREQQLLQLANDCQMMEWMHTSQAQAPTEGPMIKHVHHTGDGHSGEDPSDCKNCSDEVVNYLQSLFTETSVEPSIPGSSVVNSLHSPPVDGLSALHLHQDDVLVLTECDVRTDAMLLQVLAARGFTTKHFEESSLETFFNDTSEYVLIAKGKHLRGIKNKVVIYLESNRGDLNLMEFSPDPFRSSDDFEKLNRLRSLTSCTSQLIWVTVPKSS